MAMTEHEFSYVERQLMELHTRLCHLEANSRNAASSDQPFVGPPSQSEDSRALARPVSLAEVVSKVEYEFETYLVGLPEAGISKEALVFIKNKVLQHLHKLDQGPVAQKPAPRGMAEPPYKSTSLGS